MLTGTALMNELVDELNELSKLYLNMYNKY